MDLELLELQIKDHTLNKVFFEEQSRDLNLTEEEKQKFFEMELKEICILNQLFNLKNFLLNKNLKNL